MPRTKKAVDAAAPKRRGRPPKKQAPRTTPQVPPATPGYKYRWISEKTAEDEGLITRHTPIPLEEQAIELALIRLRRIGATLRVASTGMDQDQSDTVCMAAELLDGAHAAIAEALAMIQRK
jgi:hypothetical protein